MLSIENNKVIPAGAKILIRDEKGNVLIFALLILVLLTMIGLSASQTASIDIQIAGNNMFYKKNFYKAEGSALEAIQRMESIDLENNSPAWVSANPAFENEIENDDDKWETGFSGANAEDALIDDANAKFVVYSEGVLKTGESLDMSRSKIYQYRVYGRCEQNNGTSLIEVGYRKAF